MRRRLPRAVALGSLLVIILVGCTGGPPERPRPAPDRGFAPPSRAALAQLGPGEGELDLVAPPGFVEAGRTDPAVDWVTPFARATGCRVTVTLAETPTEAERLVRTGRYDGVAVSGDVSLRLVGDGTVAPVNTTLVPNHAGVVAGLKGKPWNSVSGVAYGVPHGRAAAVLAWRTDVVRPAPSSWQVLYANDSPYAGRITAFDSPMTLANAAVYLRTARPDLGITNPYALDRTQLDAAVELLREQRTGIRGYWREYAQQVPALVEGTVVVGSSTQTIVDLARAEQAPVKATVPAEGTTGESATWMVAARATHPNCMYRWLDHILSPEVNAKAAEWLGIAPAVVAACGHTRDREYCTAHHATDEAYWNKVAIWTTPLRDCRDDRGTVCTDYAAWRRAWAEVVG